MTHPQNKEIMESFKEKSADFINGRLSPLAFDDWFLSVLTELLVEKRKEVERIPAEDHEIEILLDKHPQHFNPFCNQCKK